MGSVGPARKGDKGIVVGWPGFRWSGKGKRAQSKPRKRIGTGGGGGVEGTKEK